MIEVLVGLIASGKSTYAKQKAREGWLILNDDSIVSAVHGGIYTSYTHSLKPLYKSIEDHILHTAIAMNKHVVIDRGVDVSKKSRRRWIAIAGSLEIPIHAIVFPKESAETHASRRFASDSRGHSYEYWLDAVECHIRRYELPELSEGFNSIKKYDQ